MRSYTRPLRPRHPKIDLIRWGKWKDIGILEISKPHNTIFILAKYWEFTLNPLEIKGITLLSKTKGMK